MPTPNWVNTNVNIQSAMPVKIDNPLTTTAKGLKVTRSSMSAHPVMDRFNEEVLINVVVTARLTYDTTGQGSALPDGKYSTLFSLGLKGLVPDGGYMFPESVTGSISGASVGYFQGERSDQLMMYVVTNGSNATGDAYLTIRYLTANDNFGYGVLFPQFK